MRMTRAGYRCRRSAGGQSMVEFIIVVPVVLFMILFVVQAVMLYRIKSTLDYAALQAARAGAVHGADRGKMRDGLARGMTPLFTHGKDVGALHAGYWKAQADMRLHSRIDVISPTQAAWNEFREKQHNGRDALPNDNLAFRSTHVGSSGVNVQDANILKIRVTYDAPLVVPFVGLVLGGKSAYLEPDTFESSPIKRLTGRLPIESYAIVRMQSPIYERHNLAR